MSQKFKVGQAVVQAFRNLDHSVTYQIVRLMPACFRGEPQYLIQCRLKGTRRLVREEEIAAAFPSSALSAWAGTSSDTPAVPIHLAEPCLPCEVRLLRLLSTLIKPLPELLDVLRREFRHEVGASDLDRGRGSSKLWRGLEAAL